MSDINNDEKFILELLTNKEGGILTYHEIQDACEEQIGAIRIVLKNLKQKGWVTFDGMMPGHKSNIELIKKL